jgi:hypothetical protein
MHAIHQIKLNDLCIQQSLWLEVSSRQNLNHTHPLDPDGPAKPVEGTSLVPAQPGGGGGTATGGAGSAPNGTS